jgi:NAD(P)H-nitrite reductase large subunit
MYHALPAWGAQVRAHQSFRGTAQVNRYLLIGTGVAAIAAAEAIQKYDPSGKVTIVGNDPFGYYSRPGLAYYLTGELPEKWLFPRPRDHFKKSQIHHIPATVRRILPSEKSVELDSATRLTYDRLLIATGAQAVSLKIPGADLQGVHKLDHLEDARALLSNAKHGRTCIITGGGITALELAEGMAKRGVRVHYILRGERYWPNVLDETESRIIEKRLKHEGIQLHHQNEISEVLGKNGKVQAAQLADGQQIKADFLAFAIGITPRITLAQEAGITSERGILVDQFMQTNQADIFAAGDVAQVYDPVNGKYVLDSLWTPAREQGYAAGCNMSGESFAYSKPIAFNVTRLAGLTTTIIGSVGGGSDPDLVGIARGDSETWRYSAEAFSAQDGFDVNRIRLMVGEKHLRGAIIMGDQKYSSILQAIIRQKMDITSIRAALLEPGAAIDEILDHFKQGSDLG